MTSRVSLFVVCASLSCSHAKTADDASGQTSSKEEQGAEPAGAEPEGAQQLPDPQAVNRRKGLIAGGEKDRERVPVASSPTGLLKPGAEQKVRSKLGLTAQGQELRPALQRFQRGHDLPATGILDHRTAQKLGLDPDELFERAETE